MFDVGFWELIILFGLGLIILGPERLPKVAMQVGNWAGQARRMARQLSTQIRDEIHDIERNNPFDEDITAEPPAYNRPGVDDLKPKSAEEADDRDHSDAADPIEDPAEEDTANKSA